MTSLFSHMAEQTHPFHIASLFSLTWLNELGNLKHFYTYTIRRSLKEEKTYELTYMASLYFLTWLNKPYFP